MRWLNTFYIAIAILLFSISLLAANPVMTPREQVIYSFLGDPDCGNLPTAGLIADRNGNLYGTTSDGGANHDGCIFKLSRNPDGGWTEAVLYSFSGIDGNGPSASLVLDKSGNLYSTTEGGGIYSGGVAFKLSPTLGGSWTETVLHNFGGGGDGMTLQSDLVFDANGNLYGTTDSGGMHNGGTVFRLSPGQNGWIETILYAFQNHIGGPGGDSPIGGVVIDKNGNLYGATLAGGATGNGTVYELRRQNGGYVEGLIHSFGVNGYDGLEPKSGLTLSSNGTLYGTTAAGGVLGLGSVFQLSRDTQGKWTESMVFSPNGNQGVSPVGPVVIDRVGNIYAAAMSGGAGQNAYGTVFMLKPVGNGTWTDVVLHTFYPGSDGRSPYAGVIINRGALFGTTSSGGAYDEGTVFSITRN